MSAEKYSRAEARQEAGQEKYDATAASMIALLRYGSGFPGIGWKVCEENWAFLCRPPRNVRS